MATATEKRILVTLTFTAPLAKILDMEAKRTENSVASLVRRVAKWHRGLTVGRHPDAPIVKLSNRVSKAASVKKGVLIDEDDAAYLDAISGRLGLPRTLVLVLLICQYLGISTLPPTKKG